MRKLFSLLHLVLYNWRGTMPKCGDCLFHYQVKCLSSQGIHKDKCNPDEDASNCPGFIDKNDCMDRNLMRRAGQYIRE